MENRLPKRKSVFLGILAALFAVAEAVLAVLVQLVEYVDFPYVAYSAIVLVFCFSFVPLFFGMRGGMLVRAGLFFTLMADWCLVVMQPAAELAGVIIFIFVQLSYGAYLYLADEKRSVKILHIILRLALSSIAIAVPAIILGAGYNALAAVSVFYYAQLIVNVVMAFVIPKTRIFAIGLLLFSFCDLSIGLKEIVGTYLSVNRTSWIYQLTHTDLNIAWIFYIPSQTVIALSLLLKNKKSR